MIADTLTLLTTGKPVLSFIWTAYWVSDVLKLGKEPVWLTIPFSANLGSSCDMYTTLPNVKNDGFPTE